ncbi:hypothetical protein M2347_001990 [Chryseobacterium sp. H1D6B]|uniref:hypothetical protein n=1 Tax=Chryseobacterium sp. H1D6B TaxID=2940588 RepID=UPI0015C9E089|nr:hypothetical protein [Chryseobacterium sp. H1D6B]MDH6252263.1 hypothetical protein [Chryseobacterium sp. H1D6B]
MKKKIIRLSVLLSPLLMTAQVGVNTTDPKGTFHVDGNKDNGTTANFMQQLNDFVVKKDGKVGIGTTNPIDLLTIVGNGDADVNVGLFSNGNKDQAIAFHNVLFDGTPDAPQLVSKYRSIAAFEGYAYMQPLTQPNLLSSIVMRTGRNSGGEIWFGTSPTNTGNYANHYNSSIDNNGNMGIGVDPTLRTAKTRLEVNGVISSTPQILTSSGSKITSTVVSVQPAVQDDDFILPNPTAAPGAIIFVRNITTTTAEIITPAGEIIDASKIGGASNLYLVGLDNHPSKTKTVMFVSDGTNWTAFKASN